MSCEDLCIFTSSYEILHNSLLLLRSTNSVIGHVPNPIRSCSSVTLCSMVFANDKISLVGTIGVFTVHVRLIFTNEGVDDASQIHKRIVQLGTERAVDHNRNSTKPKKESSIKSHRLFRGIGRGKLRAPRNAAAVVTVPRSPRVLKRLRFNGFVIFYAKNA
jgi:hypothetical protein